MNNILDLGFVVHIPSICSPYHLGIRGSLEALQLCCLPLRNMPGGGNDAPWKHFYEKGWPTDYPEKEEKSLTKSCWWLEEIMHQLRYDRVLSQLGQSFWIITRMTWSFKFWKWSVSPFRFVYFVWNWRMMAFFPRLKSFRFECVHETR